MARIVQKFGGTSVGDVERIKNVALKVKAEVDRGNEVAVVLSAMSGETNRLVNLVSQMGNLFDAREYDVVVATGEQVTIGLLALAWLATLPCLTGRNKAPAPSVAETPRMNAPEPHSNPMEVS